MPTDENEVITTGTGEYEVAYGLYINVDGPSLQAIADALMAKAKKKVEVAVKYRGVVKEYTFADFFGRLGFDDEPTGK